MTLAGALVYATGTDLVRIEFATGRRSVIYRDEGTLGAAVTRVSANSFVVSNDRGELRLLSSEGVSTLGRGVSPMYLPGTKTLLFYGKSLRGHGAALFAASLEGSSIRVTREVDAGPFGAAPPLQAVSDHEVMFYRPDGGSAHAFIFDTESGSTRSLPVVGCRPVSWIKARERLLCTEAGRVWMVRLDGTDKVELEDLRGIAVGPSSPTGHKILGSRARLRLGLGGEVFDLVEYDLDNRTLEVVAENVPLVNASGLWLTE